MKNGKPHIHQYKTEKNLYIYDVNSGEIVKVDELTYNVLSLYGDLDLESIITYFEKDYGRDTILECLNMIKDLQETRHIFLSKHPSEIISPFKEVEYELDHNLRHLVLSVTEACNQRCRYCTFSGMYPHQRTHSQNSMTFTVAKRAIDFFLSRTDKSKSPCIGFYGGEPLLKFTLMKRCVEYGRSLRDDLRFLFTTNGTLLDDEKIGFFIDHDIPFSVSLDGPKNVHDRNRILANGKGTYELVRNNLSKIQSRSLSFFNKLGIMATFDRRSNLIDLNDFFKEEQNLPETLFTFNMVNSEDTKYYDVFPKASTVGYEESRREYIDAVVSEKRETISPVIQRVFERQLLKIHKREMGNLPDATPANGMCIPGGRKLFVDTKGRFYPCERCGLEDVFCIGNIESGFEYNKIYDLIHGRSFLPSDECKKCWAIRHCGLCYIKVIHDGVFDLEKTRRNCAAERANLHSTLVLYTSILEKNPRAFDYFKDYSIE